MREEWGKGAGTGLSSSLETLHLSLRERKNRSGETQKANAEMQEEILQMSLTISSV